MQRKDRANLQVCWKVCEETLNSSKEETACHCKEPYALKVMLIYCFIANQQRFSSIKRDNVLSSYRVVTGLILLLSGDKKGDTGSSLIVTTWLESRLGLHDIRGLSSFTRKDRVQFSWNRLSCQASLPNIHRSTGQPPLDLLSTYRLADPSTLYGSNLPKDDEDIEA